MLMPTLTVRDAQTSDIVAAVPVRGWWLTVDARRTLAEAYCTHYGIRAFGPSEDMLTLCWEALQGAVGEAFRVGSAALLRQSEISPRHSWSVDEATRRTVRFEMT